MQAMFTEFTLLDDLRLFYDTRHKAIDIDVADNEGESTNDSLHLYTNKALLQREAIKFDKGVRNALRVR